MHTLRAAFGTVFLLFASVSQAAVIQVDYTGSVTALGILLEGDGVSLGDTVVGSFTYDSDASSGDSLSAFSISIGGVFNATMGGTDSDWFSVSNDQSPGFDGFNTGTTNIISDTLNGYSAALMQFGAGRYNINGQLWDDTLLPDLADWANITLADMSTLDWRWMDFGLATNNFSDDQIRWDVSSFEVTGLSDKPLPEPPIMLLMLMGLFYLVAGRKRLANT